MRPLSYPVSAIFGPTLQGEGHFVGYPCTFIRLAGCSVKECTIRAECDEAPWKSTERLETVALVDRVAELSSGGIVVITGGEPTDYDLIPLISLLRIRGYRIHLETSGIRGVAGYPLEWLTVSPKSFDYVQRTGHTLKVVVRPEWGWAAIRRLNMGTSFFHRYLQPLTDPTTGLAINLKQVKEMLMSPENCESGEWALSFQAHRAWGIR